MRKSLKRLGAVATAVTLAAGLTASAATAATVSVTYGLLLSATFEGTLQGDGNTFLVTGVQDFATIAGLPAASLTFVTSYDALGFAVPGALPTISLDGSSLDILACEDATCEGGFLFAVNSVASATIGGDIFARLTSGTTTPTAFVPSAYSATLNEAAPVPLPAGLPLLLAGIGGLALLRRRTRR
ncbi:VPLPA-CTERM sorting domain-containing protein [Pacificoceanicola onchidii]|uniref:VPLPA-CTERM sorting domain-containing protein n=1 Tax=Pacificoceanicola onchidii TaxID=2562685 RepID=UPI0010A301E3|nr:VPLPA-CTERM sorting domain-containing protein [Pacificoceanicola onchidii]